MLNLVGVAVRPDGAFPLAAAVSTSCSPPQPPALRLPQPPALRLPQPPAFSEPDPMPGSPQPPALRLPQPPPFPVSWSRATSRDMAKPLDLAPSSRRSVWLQSLKSL